MDIIKIYKVMHVLSGFLLVALTFAACAAPKPETRKRNLALTGILSLLMLVGGFGLLARLYSNEWSHWLYIKAACWLGLSALCGIAYRKPGKGGMLMWIAAILVAVAVGSVYRFQTTVN